MSRGAQTIRDWPFAAIALFLLAIAAQPIFAQTYNQTNLVADTSGVAAITDPNLVNAWGIVAGGGTGPFWINDNGTGLSTLYTGAGAVQSLVVTIPPPPGSSSSPSSHAAPTGIVFNNTQSFTITANGLSGVATFLFATEDGTISGWNAQVDPTHAILAVDHSGVGSNPNGSAVYKGLAIGHNSTGTHVGDFLYATNFRDGVVEMYDTKFNLVTTFTDSSVLPSSSTPQFAPFGIRNIGNRLFVTFAQQDATQHDDVAAAGSGFVDVFTLDGVFVKRFATGGTLNSPWGLALSPGNFGRFSNALLVGNFGDGAINAFNPSSGQALGQLTNQSGGILTIDGLWGLTFGNGGQAGPTTTLFFTAGPGGEKHGLFGSITPNPVKVP